MPSRSRGDLVVSSEALHWLFASSFCYFRDDLYERHLTAISGLLWYSGRFV